MPLAITKSFCPSTENRFFDISSGLSKSPSVFPGGSLHMALFQLFQIRCYAPVIGSFCRVHCPGQSGQKSIAIKLGSRGLSAHWSLFSLPRRALIVQSGNRMVMEQKAKSVSWNPAKDGTLGRSTIFYHNAVGWTVVRSFQIFLCLFPPVASIPLT